jgi:hypothetical protein
MEQLVTLDFETYYSSTYGLHGTISNIGFRDIL